MMPFICIINLNKDTIVYLQGFNNGRSSRKTHWLLYYSILFCNIIVPGSYSSLPFFWDPMLEWWTDHINILDPSTSCSGTTSANAHNLSYWIIETQVTKYTCTWHINSLSDPDYDSMVIDNVLQTKSNDGSGMSIKDRDSEDAQIDFVATPAT